MQRALDKAWRYQFLTYPNPAVGATVVRDGKVLAVEAHQKAGESHAEVLALKMAYLSQYPQSELKNITSSQKIYQYLEENHHHFFETCEIYVTLEPCNHQGKTPACAMLLEKIKIKKVFIGTLDPNKQASGGLERLKKANIAVEVGVLEEACEQLIFPFKKWQKEKFTFFKLAMRIDGSIDGGYITTQDSLRYVHKLRNKIDLLVIGGETVRVDKPTLDCRFASENIPPDVLIYSRKKDFETSIPLFLVPNRKVFIEEHLKRLDDKRFIMIEGGYNLLNLLKKEADYLMIFLSEKGDQEKPMDVTQLGFQEVYRYRLNSQDSVVFLVNGKH